MAQCAEWEPYDTISRLRTFLAADCLTQYQVHRMNDRQVMRTAAREPCMNAHSMHYLPVGRFDDHRVLYETADMLSDNRYAVVVRPKFMTSSTTVEQGAIFAHILGKKPGHVYAWGQGEFTQNAAAYAHPLTPGESAYLAHYNLAPVDPRALTDEQTQEAQRLFGDGPEARTQYANWRSRARIINHYKFTHPATVEGLMLYYRVTRDTNPAWFALERGWQLGSGKEMFTGKPVSRTRAGLELLLGLGVIKLFGALAKAGRRAEAPEARPVKQAKGKGMPEVESPGKKAGDIDDGIQKKYIGNREGQKKKPETKPKKDFDTEYFTAPGTGKIIKAAVDGNAAVPIDKVNTYARGKVADVRGELKSLQKLKQTKRKVFDADPENEKLLDLLKNRNHNYMRSKAMKENLEKVGLTDTPGNNKLITEHLLKIGNKVTLENRTWVPSILKGPKGSLKVESTWKILDDGRAYLSTLKFKPVLP